MDDFSFAPRTEEMRTDSTFAGDSYWRTARKKFFSRKRNIAGLVILAVLILLSIAGPHLSGHRYDERNLEHTNLAPRIPGILDGSEMMNMSAGRRRVNGYEERGLGDVYYLFGTDIMGRDQFSRCWQGLRVSLLVALAAAGINLIIGMNYGMISGYFGGRTDMIMQRVVEIIGSIPELVVVILLMMVLKPGLGTIIFAMVLTGWVDMSQVARAQTLKVREEEYVLAARTMGAGGFRILRGEIFPNIVGALITQMMVNIPGAIYLETFLSFVGLGLPPGSCSLGSLISGGFSNCLLHPYKLIPPMVILILLMISCNLIADGLREALDPARRS